MIGHPFSKIVDNMVLLTLDVRAISDDFIDLCKPLTAGMLKIVVAISKGLVDFVSEVRLEEVGEVELFVLGYPASCSSIKPAWS